MSVTWCGLVLGPAKVWPSSEEEEKWIELRYPWTGSLVSGRLVRWRRSE